jgi:predicted HTH domain antitoxin
MGDAEEESAMASLKLEVPDEVVAAVRLPAAEVEHELLKELAVALYSRGVLPFSKARILAALNRWQFDQLLAERHAPRHYGEEDLDTDIAYARGAQ